MIGGIREITYRGFLKSCNYSCNYCPFAKNNVNSKEITIDKEKWDKFCNKIYQEGFRQEDIKNNEYYIKKCRLDKNLNPQEKNQGPKEVKETNEGSLKNQISLLIAPYGEALIHDYYTKGIARLTQLNNVSLVGIQTNLSWNPLKWIELLRRERADLNKITLWCTYHPTMTKLQEFVDKVEYLCDHINLSVGVVGDPLALDKIKELREALPLQTYLWINNMDGRRKRYSENEIAQFKDIDPLFSLELTHYGENNNCSCKENHRFIESNGDVYYCNRNPEILGNIYKDQSIISENKCSKKRCDCYLSYSHLSNLKELQFFGGQSLVRVPKRLNIQAIFLDLDGTILDKDGKIQKKTKETLKYLSKKIPVYLATERPYEEVMKKCGALGNIISGGCFANGAHILDKRINYEKYYYLPQDKSYNYDENIKVYSHNDKPYKLFINYKNNNKISKVLCKIDKYDKCEVVNNRGRATVVLKGVSKLNGISMLCEKLNIDAGKIMVVGNSHNDLDMICNIMHSVAVPKAPIILKEKAKYVLEVYQLGYIL